MEGRLSSGVEQLTRNEQALGSIPRGGSTPNTQTLTVRCTCASRSYTPPLNQHRDGVRFGRARKNLGIHLR